MDRDVEQVLTDVLVIAGIALLIARQFTWRPIDRMLRTAAIVLAIGVVLSAQHLTGAARLTGVDSAVLLGELVLVGLTGVAMGFRYHFRSENGALQCRLDRVGLALWGVFILIRLGSFAVAHALGAHLLETSGAVLVSFGVNRLVTAVLVRRRAAQSPAAAGLSGVG